MNDDSVDGSISARRGRRRQLGFSVGALVLAIVLTACIPTFGTTTGNVTSAVLTTSGSDSFGYQFENGSMTITANSGNVSRNDRELYWTPDSVWYANEEACQTWQTATDMSTLDLVGQPDFNWWQPGVALRIAPTADGSGVRAITVTQNIWQGAIYVFWIYLWNTTPDGTQQLIEYESFDMSAVVGSVNGTTTTMVPPPWHVCARAVADKISFKVWTGENPEPSWDDPVAARTATVPADWVYSGYTGGYQGHIGPGESQIVNGFSQGVLPVTPPETTTVPPPA